MTKSTCPACSFQFDPDAKTDRSTPMHKHYFAMMRVAFAHWPSGYEYQPLDADAMRTFLQMRAGAVDTVTSAKTGQVYLVPRSIAYKKMSQRQFTELHDRVSRIIGEIIGVNGDELLVRQKEVA